MSRRLVDTDPDNDKMWRQRFEVLSAAGQPGPLLLDISTLRAIRLDAGQKIDPSLERWMGQLTGIVVSARADAGAVSDENRIPVTPEFQGRTDVFSTLLSAWSRASASTPQRIRVTGSPGVGKTRLLQEFAQRLKLRQVTVVSISARQRERDDPFALLDSFVARVADLPGAAGITPASASALAAFVPRFAGQGPALPREVHGGGDLLVRRGNAVADLLTAVAEDAPLAIMIDDLHWGDVGSVEVITRALDRVAHVPLLVVCASRSDTPDLGCGPTSLRLSPLTLPDLEGLMTSVAELDEGEVFDRAVSELQRASGGVPFTALRLMRGAMGEGVLEIVDGRWSIPDIEAYLAFLGRSEQPAGRLEARDDIDRSLLIALVLADGPVDLATLRRSTQAHAMAIGERLETMERMGLVVRDVDGLWMKAHALVADDVRAVVPITELKRIAHLLGEEFARDAGDMASLRRTVRLLAEGGSPDQAVALAARWYSAQPIMAYGATEFVEALSRSGQDQQFQHSLHRALFWRRRWWLAPPAVAGASGLITLAVLAAFALQPVGLVHTGTLHPASDLNGTFTYEVPPRFELRNRLGQVTRRRDGDSVRIDVPATRQPMRGRPWALLRGGVAEFDSLYPPGLDPTQVLRVSLSGMPPLMLAPPVGQNDLTLVGARLNGQPDEGAASVVRVRPGERIEGSVRLRYSTHSRSTLYVLAQTTTWQAPQRDTLTVRSLLAGISNATFTAPVSLTAPMKPGRYWILWAQAPEPAAIWVLSATNWECQRPAWGDGNDLAAQGDSALTDAVRSGGIALERLHCERSRSTAAGSARGEVKRVTYPRWLPVAGLRVEVQ